MSETIETDEPMGAPDGFIVVVSAVHSVIATFGYVGIASGELGRAVREVLEMEFGSDPEDAFHEKPEIPGVADADKIMAGKMILALIMSAVDHDHERSARLVLGFTAICDDPNMVILLEPDAGEDFKLGLSRLEARTIPAVEAEVDRILDERKILMPGRSVPASSMVH